MSFESDCKYLSAEMGSRIFLRLGALANRLDLSKMVSHVTHDLHIPAPFLRLSNRRSNTV
jgi:hypothetical protein